MSHRAMKCSARGHKEVRRSVGHIMVTARDPNQHGSKSRQNPVRSKHPRTSETYPRQDDIFMSSCTSYSFYCLMCCPAHLPKSSKHQKLLTSYSKRFLAIGELHEDKLCYATKHFTRNDTDQYHNGSPNLLTPYIYTICTPYIHHIESNPFRLGLLLRDPRLLIAFSAIKRTDHAPVNFDKQAQVSQGYTSCRNKKNCSTEVHGGGGIEPVKPAARI